ncbi:MAG: CmcJ/NvfI family oxidoreductase [Proteobacteria bacterium]|nr:CmcJ/NvfI family oxidoreductase [Pseudomonadota bacterium]
MPVGEFKFMSQQTQSSLYRNESVMIQRYPDGDNSAGKGVDLQAHELSVSNARVLTDEARPTCDRNGFELVTQPVSGSIDFLDHRQVTGRYYPQCATLVERLTGGRAYAFDHNIRSAGGKNNKERIKGGQNVQGPAHVVHGDYTLWGAPERLRQLTEPPAGNDTLRGVLSEGASLLTQADVERALGEAGRYAIINVWRNIDDQPVATHPMALCDGLTVAPQDLVVFEIHYPNRIGENYFAKYSAAHQMYYYPAMTADEALLIKQWDSAGALARSAGEQGDGQVGDGPCTFSFHSAFVDPDTPDDAPDRWSIEVRCVVLYA